MRVIVAILAVALAVALGATTTAAAQQPTPQRRDGETNLEWARRLTEFVSGHGVPPTQFSQRLNLLAPADRTIVRHHATSIVSAYILCQNGDQAGCDERARLTGQTNTPSRAAAPAAPAAAVMTAEQQDALAVWNELYPGLNSRRPDPDPRVWLRYTPAERTQMVEQCVRLHRAADILGPNYTRLQPCPHLDHFEGAAEAVRRAEIAETERIDAARAAAARTAANSTAGDLVTVRTYDQRGSYTGDRTMTRSQAETAGARPD